MWPDEVLEKYAQTQKNPTLITDLMEDQSAARKALYGKVVSFPPEAHS